MPPRGHYLPYEVAQLVGVDPKQIGQWARYGYIRSSQGVDPRVYSHQDIIEAIVVHDLLKNYGVRHKDLQQIIEAIGVPEEYGAWPLSHAELAIEQSKPSSEGKRKRAGLVLREGDKVFDFKHSKWQTVEYKSLDPLMQEAASDLARGGWVARELPGLKHIEVDPDRLSGRPTIRGRRLAAESVAELARTQEGRKVLKDDYDLTTAQVRDAERWWEAVSKHAA